MVKRYIKSWWGILKETVNSFIENKVVKLSAALAYYTVFSLPPMLIVVITTAGIVYGKEAIEGKIYMQIADWVGPKAAIQIQEAIKNIKLSTDSWAAAVLGVVTLIIGATGIFAEIQDSINTIWGIKASPKRGWLTFLINRVMSFSMVVSIGFLLLVSLIINALLSSFSSKLGDYLPTISVYVLLVANYIITFGVISLLFAIIYKVLPDARIRWRDVAVGAVATAILFMLGKFGIGMYLEHSSLGSAYGAAGSIVIILVWVYYSSIILYFGAEFTQVYAKTFGSKIEPNKYAEFIDNRTIEKT